MRSFFILTLITVGSVVMVALLELNSFDVASEVSFHRNFATLQLSESWHHQLPLNSFDFLKVDDRSVILSNRTNRRIVARIERTGGPMVRELLQFSETVKYEFPSPIVSVDSTTIFFADGAVPVLYMAVDQGMALKQCATKVPVFYDLTATGRQSVVVKVYDEVSLQDRLAVVDLQTGMVTNSNVLEKQVDGIFCVDGILLYDEASKKIVYVYYYRNEVIVADRDLCLINKIRTIDNVSTARITVDSWKEERGSIRTFSTPPLKINYRAAAHGKFLFIVSNLKSEEESREEFQQSFPVDVYELASGSYIGSFKVPSHVRKQDVLNFDVIASNETIWVIIDDHVTSFQITGLPEA